MSLHACQNNSAFTGWNSFPFFTFKDLLLADDEWCAAVIDREHLDAGEAFAKLCFLVCVCQCCIGGVLNMGALHNGFKCLPGKMD